MPHPQSGPPRRGPVPRRAPARPRPRPRRSSSGRLAVVLVVAGIVTASGVALWLVKGRVNLAASAPAQLGDTAVLPADDVAAPAEPTGAAVTEEQVRQAVAAAPLLTSEAARVLLTEQARRGQATTHALDGALAVASVGFADLDRGTLDELGQLFRGTWGHRSDAQVGRIQAYLQYARAGEPLSPQSVAAGRALIVEGVRALPAAAQGRLGVLFEKAVAAGIAHQQQAEERARVAAAMPLLPVEAPLLSPSAETSRQQASFAGGWPEPVAAGTAVAVTSSEPVRGGYASDPRGAESAAKSESYWRSRAASARSALAAAEKRVRDLEEQAARGGLVVPGPIGVACQAGTFIGQRAPTAEDREASRNARQCDGEILRQQRARTTQGELEAARDSLKRAQKALEDLEEEARRAGALPGWLR